MPDVTLHHGDNRLLLRRLIDQGVRVHSVVTDPPYGLTSVTRRFGKDGAAPAQFGTDGAFQRASAGFMGSKWDGTGIERDPEFWALIYEILLPGGYCLAFSGARTGHWQACAMELAGFVMHPMIGWVYGQGFPKAHSVSKAIDKAAGAERPVIGIDPRYAGMSERAKRGMGSSWQEDGQVTGWVGDPSQITGPATPEAATWEGWYYGAQSLKPALEPIYMAQKPFDLKTGFDNVLAHGVGGVNIDGCRVEGGKNVPASPSRKVSGNSLTGSVDGSLRNLTGLKGGFDPNLGRWPANLLHDGSDEVVALFPETSGQLARTSTQDGVAKTRNVYGAMGYAEKSKAPRGDSGSAARFFNAFPLGDGEWAAEPICDPFVYQAKATKADRAGSKHPTVKPIALMRWLCRLVTPPGGVVLDPFAGSGTTGQAARDEGFDCILMEAEEQFAHDIRRRFGLAPPAANDDDLLGFDLAEDLIG